MGRHFWGFVMFLKCWRRWELHLSRQISPGPEPCLCSDWRLDTRSSNPWAFSCPQSSFPINSLSPGGTFLLNLLHDSITWKIEWGKWSLKIHLKVVCSLRFQSEGPLGNTDPISLLLLKVEFGQSLVHSLPVSGLREAPGASRILRAKSGKT